MVSSTLLMTGPSPNTNCASCPESRSLFTGLQDVTKIDLPSGATEEEILNLCQEHCRSDHFVLIDECKAIPDTFMLGAAMSAGSNIDSTQGYRIFKKRS